MSENEEENTAEQEKEKDIDFILYDYEGESFGLINVKLKNGTELDISLCKEDCIKLCEKMKLTLALDDLEIYTVNNQQKN